jgi:hypothetical protein
MQDALKRIGKNKAPSVDGLMDVMVQRKTWGRIIIDNWHPYMENPDPEARIVERHISEVESRLTLNLTCYYNKILETESSLPYK